MESVGNHFFVSNFYGEIKIYKLPDFKNKFGCIYNNNEVADMLTLVSTTSTGIEMMNLFVLEQFFTPEKPGSFSVFNVK
jgi:hypothetical protein